jgi:hypothetical protein
LPDSLLLGRQRFAYAWLARLFGSILRHPAPDGAFANTHALAYLPTLNPCSFIILTTSSLKPGSKLRRRLVMQISSDGGLSTYRGVRAN